MPETMKAALERTFRNASDLVVRPVPLECGEVTALFLDGLTSGSEIADFVLRPLTERVRADTPQEAFAQAQAALYGAVLECVESPETAADRLVRGHCVLLFPGLSQGLSCEVRTGVKRTPSPPESENTVKGAKDAFVETLRINTSLVRRHLRTPQLRLENVRVGSRSQTDVTVCYVEGLTDPELAARMKARLESIRIDGVLSPAALEETVTGSRRTAFPLLQFTERSDQFCQGLLAGQVGVLADGLPAGYLAPVSLGRLMDSPEDRAVDYISASFVRVLRYLALFLSLLLPAVYAAMAMYHQQMIPTKLLLAIIESKRNVPFSTMLEITGLLAAFELLQEAGLHLPQAIGTAVSIIGGLVVGTAAVDADLVSPAALITAASAGICGFTLPNRDLSDAVRIWRFFLTLLAGLAGLFGVTVGFALLLAHLSGLTSLDAPYLAPFADVRADILRKRWKTDNRRREAEP